MTELYTITLPSGGKLDVKRDMSWGDLKPIVRNQPKEGDMMDEGDYLLQAALDRDDTTLEVPYRDTFADPNRPAEGEMRGNDMDRITTELYRRWIVRSEEKTALEFVSEIIMAGHVEEVSALLQDILNPKPQSADPLDGSASENQESPAA